MEIELSPIIPSERFRPKEFQYAIEDALTEEIHDITRLFQQVFETWNNPPVVHSELKASGDKITASVWTDNKIVFYLNEGTNVRHAVMTNPFVAKTSVGTLRSGRGVGGKKFVSRKIQRPGIRARHWDELIKRKRRVPYTARMVKAMAIGAKKSLFGG